MDKFTEFLKACKMLQRNRFWAVLGAFFLVGLVWAWQPTLVAWIQRPAPDRGPAQLVPPPPQTAQPPPSK